MECHLQYKNVPIEDQGKIMSVIDHIREESVLIGMEKGMEKRTEEIVKKMLQNHMDISEISSITELSVTEIELLKKELY